MEQVQPVHRIVINGSQNDSIQSVGDSVMGQGMNITDEMLQAAVGKAIEAGLLPRNACRDNAIESKEIMRLIVQAALSAEPQGTFIGGAPALARCPGTPHLSVVQDRKHAISTYAYG